VQPGSGRQRVLGLAGPGKAFGYESIIDGRPSPVTAITREPALLLVLPRLALFVEEGLEAARATASLPKSPCIRSEWHFTRVNRSGRRRRVAAGDGMFLP
jgi:CRP-like cAMP-binding protein